MHNHFQLFSFGLLHSDSSRIGGGSVPTRCTSCGVALRDEPIPDRMKVTIESSGKSYPSIVKSYDEGFLAVTTNILEAFEANNVTGYTAFPASSVSLFESRWLTKLPKPSYHILKVTGVVEHCRMVADKNQGHVCPECLRYVPTVKGINVIKSIDLNTWDGSDICRPSWLSTAYLGYSYKVIEILRQMKVQDVVPTGIESPQVFWADPNWDYTLREGAERRNPALGKYTRREIAPIIIPAGSATVGTEAQPTPDADAKEFPTLGRMTPEPWYWVSTENEEYPMECEGKPLMVFVRFQTNKPKRKIVQNNAKKIRELLPALLKTYAKKMKEFDYFGATKPGQLSLSEEESVLIEFPLDRGDYSTATGKPRWVAKSDGFNLFFHGLTLKGICPEDDDAGSLGFHLWEDCYD